MVASQKQELRIIVGRDEDSVLVDVIMGGGTVVRINVPAKDDDKPEIAEVLEAVKEWLGYGERYR